MDNPTDQQVAQALVSVIGDSKWMAVALAQGYLAMLDGRSDADAARIIFNNGGASLKQSKELVQAMKAGGFVAQIPPRERTGSAANPVTKLFPATITEQRFLESLDEITSARPGVGYSDDRETGHTLTDFTLNEGHVELPINIKNAGTRFERAMQLVGLAPDDCIPIPAYKAHAAVEARPSLIYVVSALFIRERDQGHAYDMTDAEANAAFPWVQDYWNTHGPFFARPPGGESLAQVCERVYTFLQKLARQLAGKRVLLVTHGGTIWCCRYVLEGWTFEEPERRFRTEHIPNASVTSYELEGSRLVLREAGTVNWREEAARLIPE